MTDDFAGDTEPSGPTNADNGRAVFDLQSGLGGSGVFTKLSVAGYGFMLPYAAVIYFFINDPYPLVWILVPELILAGIYVVAVWNERRRSNPLSRLWYIVFAVFGGTVLFAPIAALIYHRLIRSGSH